ncbi:hypothetical protein GGR95_003550 [Sulfitobacter undariae]|uniref:Uncharacterized protein n=1 Tax=Sulfitobacter undariae TaxID=1563671 RepID=A0A7W6H3I4_9RHOB|nr:hypothetical protein [Sulfitobacter undariae]MBB3995884.1 hypothetical protein [Sulfitobacter undariae]
MSEPKAQRKTLRVVIDPRLPLGEVVKRHLEAISTTPIKVYDTLAGAAGRSTVARILVPLISPVENLALQVVDLQNSAQALELWKEEASAFLSKARRMRRQLIVVDARSLLLNDADVLAALGINKAPEAECADIPPAPDLVTLVLADSMLSNDEEASRLVAEIEAMRSGSHQVLLDAERLSEAHSAYMSLRGEAVQNRARFKELSQAGMSMTDENALLRENVVQSQSYVAEVDAAALKARKAAAEENTLLRESVTQSQSYAVEADVALKAHNEVVEENALLRESLGLQVEAAEQADMRQSQLVEDCSILRKESADRHVLKAQVEALRRRLETDKGLVASREAIFGAVMLENQKETSEHAASGQKLAGENLRLQSELDGIYASKAWRVASVLRSVRSGFGLLK